MPNWCDNRLEIAGRNEDLKLWREKHIKGDQVTFFTAVPISGDSAEEGYAKWGTKWDADTTEIREEDGRLVCYFDTAWGPPQNWTNDEEPQMGEGWLRAVASQHPELRFELAFTESGMGFIGEFVFENGVFVKGECRSGDRLTEDDKFILGYDDCQEEMTGFLQMVTGIVDEVKDYLKENNEETEDETA